MNGGHFDRIADSYDESLPAHVVEHYLRVRQEFIADHCEPGEGLDVGCGTGRLAERLAAAGWSMVGADPSAPMLDQLRARTSRVDAVVADATALPFDDRRFDLTYCVAVLHHIADAGAVRAALGEMVRVTRPGGRILVWDHNPRNPYWPLLMRRVPQDTGEERLIREAEVVEGLRAAGAEIELATQRGLVPDFAPRALLPAFRGLERAVEATPGARRLCAHNVVLALRR